MALQFKNYIWPNDPHTYREVLSREPQYTTSGGETSYSGISATQRIITGSGIFYGEAAYEDFKDLVELAEDNSAGKLIHPVWGERYCYLTKLELVQEPREDFVSYSFEFIQARADGTVPK